MPEKSGKPAGGIARYLAVLPAVVVIQLLSSCASGSAKRPPAATAPSPSGVPAASAQPPTAAASPAAATSSSARRPRPYRQVITGRAVTDTGGITTHRVEDRWFFEVPDSLIGR